MTLMERRRGLMGALKDAEPDTTAIIDIYGKVPNKGNGNYIDMANWGTTIRYTVPWQKGYIYDLMFGETMPGGAYVQGFVNGTYDTEWSCYNIQNRIIYVNYTFSLVEFICPVSVTSIDNAYLIEKTTKTVIFAGKNTPYYNKEHYE